MPSPIVATIGQAVVGTGMAMSSASKADKMAAKQGAIADQQMAWAKQDRARYEDKYQPIEDEMLANLDVDVESRVGEATTAAEQQFAGAESARRRSLGRMGINPNSGRYQGMERSAALDKSLARTGAGNTARRAARAEEKANRTSALNFGKTGVSGVAGMMNTASSSYAGLGTQYGNAAANSMKFAMQAPNTTKEWGQAMDWGQTASTPQATVNHGISSGPTYQHPVYRAKGGEVRGAGGPTDDAIPAQLSDGEYVIPANVVRRKGTEFFDKLLNEGVSE